jgi:hypothetical protein
MAQDNPNFPVGTAAINWFDSAGQLHIRVYSSDMYTVTERCADGGGWTTGAFSAPGSQVSAMVWQASGAAHIRVYCTFEDKTTEWCSDGSGTWTQGSYTTQ